MLQYVLVKDLQTGSSYYFLVEEWLSVDNEKTDGHVDIEVEASGKAWLAVVSFYGSRLLAYTFCPFRRGDAFAAAASSQI